MQRVKVLKDYKQYKAGTTIYVTPNIAHGLIDGGIAVIAKDIRPEDYRASKTLKKAKK